MKFHVPTILLALILGIVTWLLTPQSQEIAARTPPNKVRQPATRSEPVAPNPVVQSKNAVTETPEAAHLGNAVIETPKPLALAAMAELPNGPEAVSGIAPITVMENMRAAFRQYSSRLGGNPTGNNREITAALNGGNARQLVFINAEDGLRVSEQGELVDAWGTPFFFHQLSGTEMEIRSAGPDRRMWTADDLLLK